MLRPFREKSPGNRPGFHSSCVWSSSCFWFRAAALLFCGALLVGPSFAEGPDSLTLRQARSLLHSGQYDQAIPLFRRVLLHQPNHEPARFGLSLGLLFSREGSPDAYRRGLREAAAGLEASVSLLTPIPGQSREVALRLFYLGLARWYLGQGDQSLSAFDHAYRLDPGLTQALFNSIRVAEELGREDEVIRRKQTYARIATIPPR